MTEAKHTPGPWAANDPNRMGGIELADDNYHFVDSADGKFSMSLCGSIADARLIAAAPELLEALLLAYKALDAIGEEMKVGERYTNAGQHLLDALQPARDAIAKATGEQT